MLVLQPAAQEQNCTEPVHGCTEHYTGQELAFTVVLLPLCSGLGAASHCLSVSWHLLTKKQTPVGCTNTLTVTWTQSLNLCSQLPACPACSDEMCCRHNRYV